MSHTTTHPTIAWLGRLSRVRTSYDPPPIPARSHDWCAVLDGYEEPGEPVGYGATEGAAIADLLAQLDERTADKPLDIGPLEPDTATPPTTSGDLPPPRDYAEYERRRIVEDGMRLPFIYRDPLGVWPWKA